MKNYLPLFLFIAFAKFSPAQIQTDTLVFQDFEPVPATPTWMFTGPVIYNSGYSSVSAAPPNSPIGIGGSRAWETTLNSGGLTLTFDNVAIPAGYDSLRLRFNLAAMNLNGSTGGPDDLDYVLTAISTDTGASYYNRLRIRGAINNNSFWEYAATGVAKVDYLPATEALFQPTNSGPQTTEGYSTCEIVFPGSVQNVRVRITGRSSTTTDTWLVDNLVLTGEFLMTRAKEITDEMSLMITPNPSTDKFTIQSPHVRIERIEVVDAMGKSVLKGPSIPRDEPQVDSKEWPEGIYFIKVFLEGKVVVKKVVKM